MVDRRKGEIMPDFSKCVKAGNGEVYCWDKTKKTFVRVTTNEVAITKVPPDVIEQFMEMAAGKKEAD
jgi:hypothetical protein